MIISHQNLNLNNPHKSPVSFLLCHSHLFPTLSNKWHTGQSLGRISPTKALSIYNTLFLDDQQENKTKYNQSLQLSVTEHFNKTILCIVLLILFTPYQEMIYPYHLTSKPMTKAFSLFTVTQILTLFLVAPHKNRIELNIR